MIRAHAMGDYVDWDHGRPQKPLTARAQAALEALRRGPCWRSELTMLDESSNTLKALARRGILIERVTDDEGGEPWFYIVREPGRHRHCPDCGARLSAYNPGLYCAACHVRRVMADKSVDPPPPASKSDAFWRERA